MPVYAAFDADDTCLYVGQTENHPAQRWSGHKDKHWFNQAVTWRVLPDVTERAAFDRLQPVNGQRSLARDEPIIRREQRVESPRPCPTCAPDTERPIDLNDDEPIALD